MIDSRIQKVTFKLSVEEREELNKLVQLEGKSLSDLIRIAMRDRFSLVNFIPSYELTSQNIPRSKWRVY